jgi:hypothetical protein
VLAQMLPAAIKSGCGETACKKLCSMLSRRLLLQSRSSKVRKPRGAQSELGERLG